MTVWRTTKARVATWFGFSLMCFGMFMAILDIQVVATSLPTIQNALKISPDAMSWIQTAYLIPAVFSGIFLLFPARAHPIAGTIAGIMAVLAPTVGPVVGGWITYHYSWPWLFLVNVIPGVVAAIATPFLLPRGRARLNNLKNFDGISLALMAVALASLEIGLKQAPQNGWISAVCFTLFALCAVTTALFAIRTLKAAQPVVELATLKVRPFSIGCALSFCLGVGLFGTV